MDFWSHISLREPPCNCHPWVSCISLLEGRSLSKQLTILYAGNVDETYSFIFFLTFFCWEQMAVFTTILFGAISAISDAASEESHGSVLEIIWQKHLVIRNIIAKRNQQDFCILEKESHVGWARDRGRRPRAENHSGPIKHPFAHPPPSLPIPQLAFGSRNGW